MLKMLLVVECSHATKHELIKISLGLLYRSFSASSARLLPPPPAASKRGGGPKLCKSIMRVEDDPEKLVNYCVGLNYMKPGDDVKLKPREEYPDWLWDLRVGKAPKLEELDPDTLEYWFKYKKLQKNDELAKLKSIKGRRSLMPGGTWPPRHLSANPRSYKARNTYFSK